MCGVTHRTACSHRDAKRGRRQQIRAGSAPLGRRGTANHGGGEEVPGPRRPLPQGTEHVGGAVVRAREDAAEVLPREEVQGGRIHAGGGISDRSARRHRPSRRQGGVAASKQNEDDQGRPGRRLTRRRNRHHDSWIEQVLASKDRKTPNMHVLLEQLLRVGVHISACSVIARSATSAGFVCIREQSHVNTTVGSPQVLASEIDFHRLWVSFRGRLPSTPRAIVAVIVGSPPLTSSLAAAFLDHLCRRGRRGASCRAMVRPRSVSGFAAFYVAQFGLTVVSQFWAQGFHVKEPQTAPVQRSNSQIRRTLQQTRKDPDEHHVTVVVVHGSRRIRSQSSNDVLLHMFHNMSDMQGPPEHSMIKLNSQHTSFRVQQ